MIWLPERKSRPGSASTVLIVDDEPPMREYVSRTLQKAGYRTLVAADGAEALDIAANLPSLDVVVTDVMMPEMTGDEVARRLRLTHPAIKVLYFTGYSDHLFDEKISLWEGEAYLEKPCTSKGLLEAVSQLGKEG